ncbi:MAG: mitomycin antibiotic biosynthesis protein [Gemmatimonadetes bacterium]|mgnify:CR=1 FL=1|jgi:phytanoyl-CoA hydroxylase|nr:mitomycin antibiotic biosynthesis protein [Gemmatimonadota bacterium]MBT6145393.1 mitomycin antibiotic biosynthesis protein [Gemmatimonadota bacterium]MBT7861378.1 mitomycin antibiotic biosynthesis protein [Gemmatimonadota bacterium]
MSLNQAQLDRFEEDGFLVVEAGLKDEDLGPVIAAYEQHIDRRARELLEEGKITQLHEDAPFDRRLALICAECNEIYPELDIMQLRAPAAFEFLRNKRLLDIVESIVGPEITCSPIQHIRPKLPNGLSPSGSDAHIVPWHQDAGVTWEEADPFEILTVWLPLSPATIENGCLEVIPKTHGTGLWQHESRPGTGTTIVDAALPDIEPVTLPMNKGDVLLQNKEIPHRSLRNLSDTVRWSMDLRYQQTGTPSGRPFHPSFVARSRSNPASELSEYATWNRLWDEAIQQAAIDRPQSHRWAAPSNS